ncbi:MAG: hypothetical protein IT280_01305 [Ignavibacteria bacterium]|nr:hypothetical protein [Ignavibacteria bacterium]
MDKKLIDAINEFINNYKQNPFQFLTESDIKCCLYSYLIKSYKDTFEINTEKYLKKEKDQVNIPVLTTEYHYFYKGENDRSEYSKNRFDIAILNKHEKKALKEINEQCGDWFNSEALWIQPVKYGIEIKLFYDFPFLNVISSEIEKLKGYYYSFSPNNRFKGISLSFCHIENDINSDFKPIDLTELELCVKFNNFVSIIVMPTKTYLKIFD